MEIDRAIENLKAMLSELRKEDIDDLDEQEPNIDRQEFYNETTPIYFNTDKTTIIFALTKKLRQDIIEELKKNPFSLQDGSLSFLYHHKTEGIIFDLLSKEKLKIRKLNFDCRLISTIDAYEILPPNIKQ
jgi:predicted nucleic acid-binding OB-fold protein